MREEWNGDDPAQNRRRRRSGSSGRTPDPATFEADIARVGEMIVDGDSARLMIPTPSGDYSAMGFAVLEDGKWRVNRGPMTLAGRRTGDSAPAIRGAAILDHEWESWRSTTRRSSRRESSTPRSSCSRPRRAPSASAAAPTSARRATTTGESTCRKPEVLASQIRDGGELTFTGQKAFLNVVSSTTTQNADGSVTSTSETIGLGFENEAGKWRIAY